MYPQIYILVILTGDVSHSPLCVQLMGLFAEMNYVRAASVIENSVLLALSQRHAEITAETVDPGQPD